MAADLQNGAEVFRKNCAVCHKGGNNTLVADKTLKIDALEKYSKNSISAIMTQIKTGMKTMPSFQAKLTVQEIDNVANYVIQQAESGWQSNNTQP
jgi:cytochrome c6